MIYPYRCKTCNSVKTVDKPTKDKAKFEYCEHCKSDEPMKEVKSDYKFKKKETI